MTNKPHISKSQLDLITKWCAVKWEFRYVKKVYMPPAVKMLSGTAAHEGFAHTLRRKANQETLAPGEAAQVARDAFAQRYERDGILWSPEDRERGVEAAKGEAIDSAVAAVECFESDILPTLSPHPERIEWAWRIETELSYDLEGVTDLETLDADGTTAVHDHKTSSKSPGKTDADDSDELTLYALAHFVHDGELPDTVQYNHVVLLKGGPKAVISQSVRTEHQVEVLWRRVERAIHVIESGAFMPRENDWYCQSCEYAAQCEFFAGKRQVQVPADF